jgi:putative restriction endonuclease
MSTVETAVLNSKDLKYLLIDSLKIYSDFVFYVSGNNPYTFSINKKTYHFFIRNTHSSGLGRPNPDESRIQINRTEQFLSALNTDDLVFFLGYSDDCRVFTAWNPYLLKERINAKRTISVYSRFSVQQKAAAQGIALYEDTNGQKVISFKPEYLGLYLENFEKAHLSSEDSLLALLKESDNVDSTGEQGKPVVVEEEKFTVTKHRQERDPNFRKKVYLAYDFRCAFSGMQLDLVEAAHIVPYSHELGTDDVQNGICLSPLHHAAYDAGLIYIDEDYSIKMNKEKSEYLEKIGRDGGLNKFIDLQYARVTLPKLQRNFPSVENIRLANKIRGIVQH